MPLFYTVLSLALRLSAGFSRARFSLPRAFFAWVLSGVAAWFAVAAVGIGIPLWVPAVAAITGFVLSFRFPQTRVAPIVDFFATGLWMWEAPQTFVAAAVFSGFGWLADNRIFRHRI